MINIMFVCHGNICRSPMAEFIMKDMVAKKGLADKFHIASCATSTEEIWHGVGNPVYPPARRELAKHGISCDGKRAVQITPEDYDKYDIILCMDSNNMRNIKRIISADPDGKIHKLMAFAGTDADVADPWYTGDFTTTYNDVLAGCTGLLEYLVDNMNK
ncbi:MAG: low molecular weight phosphotyrosine protein phosphatase [Oscillospiraceae bacterium]|nr:low molecular weight phosphotyrosine protein phosphatase [Oscillospiraceae bacterium]